MDGPSSKLAGRFRRALETDEERKVREREASDRLRDEGRRAREALFQEIHGLAKEIGLSFEASAAGVTLKHKGHFLHFGRDGDGERVKLQWEGLAPEEAGLIRQPELGNRWVLVRKRGVREARVPLFDQGMEELFVKALQLPKPSE